METPVISYYNPSHQSQSRACRPTDALMWKIGENVEIIRLKEQLAKAQEELLRAYAVGAEHARERKAAEETIQEWEAVGINRFSSDEPDDVDYSIQSLIDDHNQAEEDFEEEKKDLEAENKKLKGYLGELGSLLDANIDDSGANSERPVAIIYADAFDKLTNNEFKGEEVGCAVNPMKETFGKM